MHNILICDDNKEFTRMLKKMLDKYADLYDATIIAFDNGNNLLEYCYDNKFDVIYMDVDLGKKNGLDIAKTLKDINPDFLIIYISQYEIYYKDMVNAEPFKFVSKNASDPARLEKELVDALSAAIRRLDKQNGFSFTFNKTEYTIDLDRIEYFHSVGRRIYIYGDTDGAPDYFYEKIGELQEKLEKIDPHFVRISNSYVINIKFATKVSGEYQIRVGSRTFSVTRKYREIFKKYTWKIIY